MPLNIVERTYNGELAGFPPTKDPIASIEFGVSTYGGFSMYRLGPRTETRLDIGFTTYGLSA